MLKKKWQRQQFSTANTNVPTSWKQRTKKGGPGWSTRRYGPLHNSGLCHQETRDISSIRGILKLIGKGKHPHSWRDDVNRTPTHTTCTDERSVSAHHTAQSDHFTRTRVAQRPNRSRLQALVRLKIVCHPRVMSRFFFLPHLTPQAQVLSQSPL